MEAETESMHIIVIIQKNGVDEREGGGAGAPVPASGGGAQSQVLHRYGKADGFTHRSKALPRRFSIQTPAILEPLRSITRFGRMTSSKWTSEA